MVLILSSETVGKAFSPWSETLEATGLSSDVAQGMPNVWYTMQLNVTRTPFVIAASILDENGTSLGFFSTSDIDGFSFENIRIIGIGVWGYQPSDYLFKIVQSPSSTSSNISIMTQCTSTSIGSSANIFGTLTGEKGQPLENKAVIVSYSFSGIDYWIAISSVQTDKKGQYSAQWINNASGSFLIKAEWSGDSTYATAKNITTLSFLPYQSQQLFVFESNSTVTGFSIDNQTSILTFNVTGDSGTTGYVKTTIAKSLLPNGESLVTYFDGNKLDYLLTESPILGYTISIIRIVPTK